MSDAHDFLNPHMPALVAGKTYEVGGVTAEQGLRLHLMFATPGEMLWSDDELIEQMRLLLGDMWDVMLDDGVSWPELLHVARTALIWYGQSAHAGALFWDYFDREHEPAPPVDESEPEPEWPEDGEAPGSRGPDDPGGGPYDEATGLRDWYYPENYGKTTPAGPRETLTWAMMLEHWELVELDFQQFFGIDLESGILKERSFRWLNARVWGVLTEPQSRLRRKFGDILTGR
ncbi:hypothetical protein CH289_07650 [Rhodococcus sp. RS1C4]|nr:hypothetical protein [Rhodococcus sp. RS1C4]OZC55060.1 hypothetical protein CH289_07650 [Rhodococcus sp. RS1C4]